MSGQQDPFADRLRKLAGDDETARSANVPSNYLNKEPNDEKQTASPPRAEKSVAGLPLFDGLNAGKPKQSASPPEEPVDVRNLVEGRDGTLQPTSAVIAVSNSDSVAGLLKLFTAHRRAS